jgi:hypothetical protein
VTPQIIRLLGIFFLIVAAVLMILNLRSAAGLGTFWAAMPPFIVGIALLAMARERSEK